MTKRHPGSVTRPRNSKTSNSDDWNRKMDALMARVATKPVTQVAVATFTLDICMAGDLTSAEAVCRDYCDKIGLCVTLTPTLYIYTGGREDGFKIGLINYPRFPTDPEELWGKAVALADLLREHLGQESYSIISPNKTLWQSWREV